jgi:hypothetical protein
MHLFTETFKELTFFPLPSKGSSGVTLEKTETPLVDNVESVDIHILQVHISTATGKNVHWYALYIILPPEITYSHNRLF